MQKVIIYFTRNLNFHSNQDFAKGILNKVPQTLGEIYKIVKSHISVDEALQALYPRTEKKHNPRRNEDE